MNWGIRILQTLALPLGYGALCSIVCGGMRDDAQEGHIAWDVPFLVGASDEARTRYLHLGKVALYQMSYTRMGP